MVYYTGDIHGNPRQIAQFCRIFDLTEEDTLILLGDVGANYFLDWRDKDVKERLNRAKPTILCIHGNHEVRPQNIPSYHTKSWCGGAVWYEKEYPNLLFARDGEIYTMEGIRHLAIGGAYSVDKYYRLEKGMVWWPGEQPSPEIRKQVEESLDQCGWTVDTVISHTCPYRYEPREAFLPSIDQSTVDDSTERWLDGIEQRLSYKHWYCGHWHINKKVDKLCFLFHDVLMAEG